MLCVYWVCLAAGSHDNKNFDEWDEDLLSRQPAFVKAEMPIVQHRSKVALTQLMALHLMSSITRGTSMSAALAAAEEVAAKQLASKQLANLSAQIHYKQQAKGSITAYLPSRQAEVSGGSMHDQLVAHAAAY